jgi:hypothetical protein
VVEAARKVWREDGRTLSVLVGDKARLGVMKVSLELPKLADAPAK